MQLLLSNFASDEADWWNDTEYLRMQRVKPRNSSRPRMKKMMVNFFFTYDFDEILYHWSHNYKGINSYSMDINKNSDVQSSSEELSLELKNIKPTCEEKNIEDTERDEIPPQVKIEYKYNALQEFVETDKGENKELIEEKTKNRLEIYKKRKF